MAFRSIIALVGVLLLASCTDVPRYHPPELIAESLQGALSESHHILINLDGLEPQPLYAESSFSEDEDSDLFLEIVSGITVAGDSIYVTDSQRSRILIAHKEDDFFSRAFGSPGAGPDEFGPLSGIQYSEPYFYISDRLNQTLHVYDTHLNYVDKVFASPLGPLSVAATSTHLISSEHFGSDPVFAARGTGKPFTVEHTFLPRLPTNRIEWAPVVAGSDHGPIVAGYLYLPYLLVYNQELNLTLSIEFTGRTVLEFMEIDPAIEEISRMPSMPAMLFYSLWVLDSGTIVFGNKSTIFVLSPKGSTYELTGKYNLYDLPGVNFEGEPARVSSTSIVESGSFLYVASRYNSTIYRYRKPW